MPSSGTCRRARPTASDVSGNAFYCSTKDVVAWDAEGLLPELQEKYGDFVIPVVLAHEWGHAIQARSNFTARTVTKELQADCFAGAWAKHAQGRQGIRRDRRRPGHGAGGHPRPARHTRHQSKIDPNAHGSGFDRVSAFQDGFDNGLDKCKDYRDDEPMVLELPFNDEEDAARGGDAPVRLDRQRRAVRPRGLLDAGLPRADRRAGRGRRSQGSSRSTRTTRRCAATSPRRASRCSIACQTITSGWDNVGAMPEVYRQGGDYAVATLLATQYGLAALTRLGDESDEKTSTLRGDCLAGGYTASVILYNRPETSTYHISPGDLDEGIKALLVFRGEGDVERQGAGFERVRAFREGVINGAEACLDYEDK